LFKLSGELIKCTGVTFVNPNYYEIILGDISTALNS
jgi:hypothetical protein